MSQTSSVSFNYNRIFQLPSDLIINSVINNYLSSSDAVNFSLTCHQAVEFLKSSSPIIQQSITDVHSLLKIFPKIRDIKVSGEGITDDSFKLLSHVRSLTVLRTVTITNNAFAHLNNLQVLALHQATALTDDAFHYSHFNNLTELKLYHCNNITEKAFLHLSSLHSLSLTRCENIGNGALVHCAGNRHIKQTYISFNYSYRFLLFCLSLSTVANLRHLYLSNADGITRLPLFPHIETLTVLNHLCNIDDLSIQYQTSLKNLYIVDNQIITDASISNLVNLHTLVIVDCNLITSNAFVNLTNIHTLNIYKCSLISDKAFVNMNMLTDLNMSKNSTITNISFVHAFRHLHTLTMMDCRSSSIINATSLFRHLLNLYELDISRCEISDSIFDGLPTTLRILNINSCNNLTNHAFTHFTLLHTLLMPQCSQTSITDDAFQHLTNLHTLSIANCNQSTITDIAFTHLKNVRVLDMSFCNQTTVTNVAFTHLNEIVELYVDYCDQYTINQDCLSHFTSFPHHPLRVLSSDESAISLEFASEILSQLKIAADTV